MMSSSRDTAQRASDLSALILTAGVIGVSLLVRPFQWREQGPRTPADQPVELSVEDPPDTTPTPPAPPPRLVPHEIVTRVPVPEVPDPVTLTDDPIPESAVVVAALNPSPPKASLPAGAKPSVTMEKEWTTVNSPLGVTRKMVPPSSKLVGNPPTGVMP